MNSKKYFSLGRSQKRGAIGSFTVMWVSTVIIIIILTIFVLGSGLVKKISNVDKGVSILNETVVGLGDFQGYMNNYVRLRNVSSLVFDGEDLSVAIEEAGYEE